MHVIDMRTVWSALNEFSYLDLATACNSQIYFFLFCLVRMWSTVIRAHWCISTQSNLPSIFIVDVHRKLNCWCVTAKVLLWVSIWFNYSFCQYYYQPTISKQVSNTTICFVFCMFVNFGQQFSFGLYLFVISLLLDSECRSKAT